MRRYQKPPAWVMQTLSLFLCQVLITQPSFAVDSEKSEKPSAQNPDDLTTAALRRSAERKSKATKAAKAAKKKASESAAAKGDAEVGPIITSRPVTSAPAPGASALTHTDKKTKVVKKSAAAAPGESSSSDATATPHPQEDKAETKADAKTDTKVDAKSEAKPDAKIETKADAKSDVSSDAAGETKPTSDKNRTLSSVSAETSLKWLTNGNTRFVKRRFRADGRSEKDRLRLVKSELPHAIVLACSDSRVPPEIVFDQSLGEIYVIRVAGEAVDDSVVASVEYALENFGSHLLIVMGHTQCGAVQAAIDRKPEASGSADGGSESLTKVLASIQTHLKSRSTEQPSPGLQIESTLNADGVARELVTRSEIIRKHVEAKNLTIKPALYRLDSGKVSFY